MIRFLKLYEKFGIFIFIFVGAVFLAFATPNFLKLGTLLNIKPVLEVNADGIIEPFKKVRGRQQAIAALAQHLAEDSKGHGRMRVALLHACCPESAQELEDAIVASGADVEWDSHGAIGAVIGVYTGPGAIGCAYYPIG